MLNSRTKGRKGENEAIALLQPDIDEVCAALGCARIELIRDSRQRYQKKLYDVFGVPWMALEIKRHEDETDWKIDKWWRQVKDATKPGQVPVLMYRENRKPWRIRMKAPIYVGNKKIVRMTVNITIDDFRVWFKSRLRFELTGRRS